MLRSDCRARLLDLAQEMMLRANWDTWESWPGWDRLMEVSRWKRSALAGWLRQLRLLGWLSVIESGSTPQFRPMVLSHVEGNRRAVYALRVPRRPGEQATAPQPPARPEPELETVPAEPFTRSDQRGRGLWIEPGPLRGSLIFLLELIFGFLRAREIFSTAPSSARRLSPRRSRFAPL
uniref:ORF8 n=1 Tax=Amycolatopsis benzoatilytica TaxID=346045 RepID=A3FG41_9PSEU|nr:unknown [Cloning vector pDXM32]ABN48417.1 ORF8 [Amycolatopsis benzoatilytica]